MNKLEQFVELTLKARERQVKKRSRSILTNEHHDNDYLILPLVLETSKDYFSQTEIDEFLNFDHHKYEDIPLIFLYNSTYLTFNDMTIPGLEYKTIPSNFTDKFYKEILLTPLLDLKEASKEVISDTYYKFKHYNSNTASLVRSFLKDAVSLESEELEVKVNTFEDGKDVSLESKVSKFGSENEFNLLESNRKSISRISSKLLIITKNQFSPLSLEEIKEINGYYKYIHFKSSYSEESLPESFKLEERTLGKMTVNHITVVYLSLKARMMLGLDGVNLHSLESSLFPNLGIE